MAQADLPSSGLPLQAEVVTRQLRCVAHLGG